MSISPRIGISHPVSDNQMLFFSYGHFSKLPRPQFVYAKLNPVSAKSTFQKFGNPDLDPERARSAEFGLTYNGAYGLARVTAFVTRTRDLINSVFVPPSSFVPTNVGEAENRGVEVSWRGTVAGLDVRSALTFQNPEDKSTGLGLLRRADRFGSVSLGQARGAFDWRAEVLASGPHPDVHATTYSRVVVPGYAVLNLNLGWKPARDWKLSGKLLNLLDKDYALVHGYNTQGRGAFIELAYAPK